MVDVPYDTIADIPPAEVEEVELYHPKSWWTHYVFSQDAKVIAIQYSLTASAIGLVALVLSWCWPRPVSCRAGLPAPAGRCTHRRRFCPAPPGRTGASF